MPDAVRDEHAAAMEEADRLTGVIDALLALARAEGRPAHRVPLPIDPVIADRADAWSAARRARGAPPPAPRTERAGRALGRRRGLETVLDAVLDNAVKYAPPGSEVELATARVEDHVEIAVRDHGHGLDPGELERATDRFWRSPSQQRRRRHRAGAGDRRALGRARRRRAAAPAPRRRRAARGAAPAVGVAARRAARRTARDGRQSALRAPGRAAAAPGCSGHRLRADRRARVDRATGRVGLGERLAALEQDAGQRLGPGRRHVGGDQQEVAHRGGGHRIGQAVGARRDGA